MGRSADYLSLPDELTQREKRLSKGAEARSKIEARACERFQRKPGGKPPEPPTAGHGKPISSI